MKPVLVYMTAKDQQEASKIAEAIVAKELAACVNYWDGASSVYRWEGKVEKSSETVLIAKTTEDYLPALTALVKAIHSYSCPCVVALPIEGGNSDYLNWIKDFS